MFSSISRSFAVVMTFAILAAAMPGGSPPPAKTTTVTVTAPASTSTPASSCSSGDLQSCKSTTPSSSAAGSALLSLLGVVVDGVDVVLGIDCSPIDVINVGSGSNAVCCENNNFNGLVAIGCVPVTI